MQDGIKHLRHQSVRHEVGEQLVRIRHPEVVALYRRSQENRRGQHSAVHRQTHQGERELTATKQEFGLRVKAVSPVDKHPKA